MSAVVLHGTAVARTELLLRRRKRRDNILESLPYIPGSAVRGHLASRWVAERRPVDERFRRIFLSGEVRFEHAYPMIGDRPTVPAPLTLAACKSHPLERGHFAADLLARDGLQTCAPEFHGGTGAPLKRLRGFVTVDGGRGWRIDDAAHLVTRQRIGTLRDGSGRADADGGALFEEVLIARGTRFWIEVRGPDTPLAELTGLLGAAPATLTVGRSRTVMGQIDWVWAHGAAERAMITEAGRHSLLLISDTILLDRYQRAVIDLGDPAVLAKHVLGGVKPTDVDVHGAVGRPTAVGGWDALHQLPKPIDTAIVAGSVVSFSAPPEAIAALAERPGLGWRQSEGFGRFALDSPIHAVDDWRSGRPAPPAPDTDRRERRHAIAAKAVEVARQLKKAEVSRSLWQGIEATVRSRQALVEHPPPPERHPQAASGRGAGVGEAQRDRRNQAIGAFERAVADLQLGDIERIVLADDIGQELDLLLRPRRRRPRGVPR